MAYTIDTTKGSFTGTLRACCEWQANYQGRYATIDMVDEDVDVSGVDFDAENMDATLEAVRLAFLASGYDFAGADGGFYAAID